MSDQNKEPVKQQVRYNGGGFDVHPDHINKEGGPERGWSWRELFMKIAEEDLNKKKRKEVAAEAIWKKMEEGDVKAFEKIADRMEGKALEHIDHTSGGEKIQGIAVEYVRNVKTEDTDTGSI